MTEDNKPSFRKISNPSGLHPGELVKKYVFFHGPIWEVFVSAEFGFLNIKEKRTGKNFRMETRYGTDENILDKIRKIESSDNLPNLGSDN